MSLAMPAGSRYRIQRVEERRFLFQLHAHAECELTLILRGHGTRMVGYDMEAYGEGDLVFLGANVPHCWQADEGDHRALVLQFAEYFPGHGFVKQPEAVRLRELYQRRGVRYRGKTRDAVKDIMLGIEGAKGIQRLMLVIEVLKRLTEAEGDEVVELIGAQEYWRGSVEDGEKVDRTYRYIRERVFTGNVSVKEVAAHVDMAVSTFSRFFKRQTGRSLMTFVNEVRLQHAIGLLTDGYKSISEAAWDSGYENLSHFNRQFKARYGESPRGYLRKIRELGH